jgi:hypothetical protein
MDISSTAQFSEYHAPHFILLNLAVGGSFTGIESPAGITAPFPAQYLIDYVRIYDNGHTVLGGSSIDGDNSTSNLEMILVDKRGKKRVRELRALRKDKGEDDYSMMFFLSPADVKDTGFLTYDYDAIDRDDDQWLYLPALKKTKRIASSNKSGSFMGSDFSYADMTDRPLVKYDYTLLKEDEIHGHPVWVIESVPNDKDEIDETGYTKSIHFVRQDNLVVIRSKAWLKKGRRNKYMEVKELEQIDGIWVPTLVTMITKKGDQILHRTMLRTSDVKFDQPLDFDSFSVRGLESGP